MTEQEIANAIREKTDQLNDLVELAENQNMVIEAGWVDTRDSHGQLKNSLLQILSIRKEF